MVNNFQQFQTHTHSKVLLGVVYKKIERREYRFRKPQFYSKSIWEYRPRSKLWVEAGLLQKEWLSEEHHDKKFQEKLKIFSLSLMQGIKGLPEVICKFNLWKVILLQLFP